MFRIPAFGWFSHDFGIGCLKLFDDERRTLNGCRNNTTVSLLASVKLREWHHRTSVLFNSFSILCATVEGFNKQFAFADLSMQISVVNAVPSASRHV